MKAGGAVGVANDIEAVQEQNDFSDSANSRYAENNESISYLPADAESTRALDQVKQLTEGVPIKVGPVRASEPGAV